MHRGWSSSKVTFISMYLIEAQVNEEMKLKSMCDIMMVRIEAKEEELVQLMRQKLGISIRLAN